MRIVIDAGAEDMKNDPSEAHYAIITAPEDLKKVKDVLLERGIPVSVAEITMLPKSCVSLDGSTAEKMIRLMEILEDLDDVQNVYANFDIPDEVMAKAEK
ncbi:putative transcriptional regulatory protein [bacterium BMS3Bbin07]|nr:putative transcriptional regulatory protein [bacterium BMS3Bbin07]